MGSSTPRWALLSSAAAPVALIGGWTLAAQRQPDGYDSTVATISSLAASGAADRWVMTAALLAVGVCHAVTALGLSRAAPAGRVALGLGGVATMLVAALPLPAVGAAPAHAAAAGVAFVALAVWPALAWRRRGGGPVALRPVVSLAAARTGGVVRREPRHRRSGRARRARGGRRAGVLAADRGVVQPAAWSPCSDPMM
jgi:hypothetical protein